MRATNRLKDVTIRALHKPGWHADGDGLYVRVTETGKRWVYVFHRNGKRRELGLGAYPRVSLKEAREHAEEARKLVRKGLDPIAERKRKASQGITFGEVADAVLKAKLPGFKNEKHQAQWERSIKVEMASLRPLSIEEITTEHVLEALKKPWRDTPESARRLRGRIEAVLDAAKAKGLRSGDNPAIWRGNLVHWLPKRPKLQRGNHKAVHHKRMPAFWATLVDREGVAAKALQFTILTAARTSEVTGAKWNEIDIEHGLWTVPAERMKAGLKHEVPLSASAIALLEEVRPLGDNYVFPGLKGDALSSAAMHAVLKRMKVDATVHGFRSSFRDWAGDETEFPREVAEAALAHKVGDAVELAYRRSNALDKRRALMTDWAEYLLRDDAVLQHAPQHAEK